MDRFWVVNNSELVGFGVMLIYPWNSKKHFEMGNLIHDSNDRNESHFCQHPFDELSIKIVCLEVHLEDGNFGFDLVDEFSHENNPFQK